MEMAMGFVLGVLLILIFLMMRPLLPSYLITGTMGMIVLFMTLAAGFSLMFGGRR